MDVKQTQVFPKLLTVRDVSEILSVPLSTLHHWAVQGAGPPSFKVGRHRRYDAAVVAAWLEKQQRDVA